MPVLILQREHFRKGKPTRGGFYFSEAGRTLPLRIDSLELEWRNNEPRVSCIPDGVYPMKWTDSPAFRRFTWELLNVPRRSAIRIHSGNYAGRKITDSLGCILPCMDWGDINSDGVTDGLSSTIALRQLEAVLDPYHHNGITIDVRNAA